jgi:hypothetical protein
LDRMFIFAGPILICRGDAEHMASEWLARAELAEAYAQRAARTEGRA